MEEETRLPEWFKDFVTQYQAGISREFILFGNINDLVRNPDDEPEKPYISFREFWEKVLDEREMVVLYSMAWGLRFPSADMEERFRKASGFDQPDSSSSSPLAKAGVLQKRRLPQDPEICLLLIERVLRNIPKTAVMIYFAHHIVPAGGPGGVTQTPSERVNIERFVQWASSVGIKESGGIVLLFTDKIADIASELRTNSGIKTIPVPKPSREELKTFINAYTEGDEDYQKIQRELRKLRLKRDRCKTAKKRGEVEKEIQKCEEELQKFPNLFPLPENFDAEKFAHAAQGLGYQQILEVFLRAKERGEEVNSAYVKAKKKEILNIEFGEVMEVMEPEAGLDNIGGLEYVKDYFRDMIKAIRDGETRLVPMGVTLTGPPGTGKTEFARALAFETGCNCVKAKNLLNMFVGGSEERMQLFKYGVYSLAPVIIINDEADLSQAQRDAPKGDSGVSERQMREWMDLLSDPKIRGRIVVINLTNRPDRIDPALKRSGRSDERILLPMPPEEAREAIFHVMFKRYKIPTNISEFWEFAKLTDELSGSDIEKITLASLKFAFKAGKDKVDEIALREAIEDTIPTASQAEVDMMTLMGLLESSSRRLVPPHIKETVAKIKARNLVKNLDQILAQIKERKIAEID